ncbi:YadA C-terminal domain-containing protein, partial [Lelliottia sp. RWM.1]
QALHAAMLEQKFGQVKGNIQRTAPQVIALQQAEGDARVADNQTRTAGQTQALHAAMLEQKFGQVKGNIQRTAPQVTALQQAEGDARVVSNQQRTLAQSQALTDSKANAVDVTKNNTLNTLSASVTRAEAKGEEAQSRADIAYAHAEENENAIQATNHRVAENSANIAAEEEQITTLKSDTDKNFSKMNNRIDENRQRASAAISGVAAMANIPQVIQGQTFSIGAGVGSTDGESAAAVGFSARAGERVIVKASVSDDTQQNFVIGGGVSYGW